MGFTHTYTIDWELGYKLYNKIVSLIIPLRSGQVITVINSTIYFLLLYRFIKDYSSDKCLSAFLFLILGFYQSTLNTTRNAIASMIIFSSLKYIKESKPKFCITVLIASLFHTSSIFYLIMLFEDKILLNKKKLINCILICILMILCFKYVVPILYMIVPDRYQYFCNRAMARLVQNLSN